MPNPCHYQDYDTAALPCGTKPPFSIAATRTTRRRTPASANTNQGPERGGLIALGGLGVYFFLLFSLELSNQTSMSLKHEPASNQRETFHRGCTAVLWSYLGVYRGTRVY